MAENFTEIVTNATRVCSNTTSSIQNNHSTLPQLILKLILNNTMPDVFGKTMEILQLKKY